MYSSFVLLQVLLNKEVIAVSQDKLGQCCHSQLLSAVMCECSRLTDPLVWTSSSFIGHAASRLAFWSCSEVCTLCYIISIWCYTIILSCCIM